MKNIIEKEDYNVPVYSWIGDGTGFNDREWEGIDGLAKFPYAFHHIVLCPDFHPNNFGMPIGSVLATKDVIIPGAVGNDIGCQIMAMKTTAKVSEISQEVLRKQIMRGIRKLIPIGDKEHKTRLSEDLLPQTKYLEHTVVCKRSLQSALKHLGTLGNGNHFLELDRDSEDNLWILVHSGSRSLGGKTADYYKKKAENFCKLYKCPDPVIQAGLAFLPLDSLDGQTYWNEMKYCIEFATISVGYMMDRVKEVLAEAIPGVEFSDPIGTVHNFAAIEVHYGEKVIVHRKGAAKAEPGKLIAIPGSQGTKSYIVEGLGNPESFMSSSHGAGRKLSRGAAVHQLSLEEEQKKLEELGIVHSLRFQKDLEEAAGAYKDINEVLKREEDLVKPIIELSPVAVIKGV